MTDPQWVPTVQDLRVKLCYICREEERYDSASEYLILPPSLPGLTLPSRTEPLAISLDIPSARLPHPTSRLAQDPEDPPRAWTHPCSCTLVAHESCLLEWIKSAQQDSSRAGNALKCPQCGATYELESDNPRILRLLNAVNAGLSAAGKAATVVGFVGLTATFGFTLYVVSTSYGVFAVKEFLGEEMYNILLTDDPSVWPWHAFIHLPIIPFSLILSRTRLFDTFPIVPLFLTWSSSPPARAASPSSSLWTFNRTGAPYAPPPLSWPPTPIMGMILFPFVRITYRRFFNKLTRFVMGTHADAASRDGGPIRRVIWALNENGPAPLRVRIGANIQPVAGQAVPRAGGAGAQDGQGEPAVPPEGEGNNNLPDDPAAVAERTLHVTTSSLGRFVGGALLVPTISNRMGKLLYHLSQYLPWLRAFLAIRDRPANVPAQIGAHLATGINIMFGGTPTWNAQDPVWWRNTVGLGLFVFAKDCVRLLHLYLTKRELESRKVKNRSFAGVDIRELDLINPPPESNASSTTEPQPAPAPDVTA
ncbi:hypothetical protein BD311DRAFT_863557 [Dichomitus squalens]|uniref:RING-CH-type domain-containing protein n=1 Tax=Dichomitus squalens TaxID=114155 RepID=A0A4Q9MTU2_9APHY|nr:hypothetical protein BD311DRAFT_863557 [Dichomitus squalens]